MKIRYLGHSCFEITAKNGKKIITDPYQGVGYEMPRGLSADVVTVSHGHFDHNYTAGMVCVKVLTTLQPYAESGIEIYGIPSYHDEVQGAKRGENILFKMQIDGITLCHMGDIGEECTSSLVQRIGKVDVLFLPVGGTYTVDAAGAMRYAEKIQPKILLPMHYRPVDGALDIAGMEPFLALCKGKPVQEIEEGVLEITEDTQGIFYMHRVK